MFTKEQLKIIEDNSRHSIVIANAGCLTGDTSISINRCKVSKKISLRDLFFKFNNLNELIIDNKLIIKPFPKIQQFRKESITFCRSYIELDDRIKLNEIEHVWYSGKKDIYKLILENGYELKGTYEHPVLTKNNIFVKLGELTNNHYVMVDDIKRHEKTGKGQVSKPKFIKVREVVYLNIKEDTFDISCKDPNNNFVANKIIVHNTGKSTCMIAKIKHLVEKEKMLPERVLMTSFSKVASKELVDKSIKEIGYTSTLKMSISTIHAISYKIVSENLDKTNISSINIVSESYLAGAIFNACKYDNWYDSDPKGKKQCKADVNEWRKSIIEGVPSHFNKKLLSIFEEVNDNMQKTNKILFDDLLIKSFDILGKYEDVQEEWSNKYGIIICDEVQDTSKIQFDILEYLIGENTRTCIVGDVKQNIYAFRGAHYMNMENFRKKYNSHVLFLSETFRFNQAFADVSNRIIDKLTIDPIYKKYTKTNVTREGEPEYFIDQFLNQVEHVYDDIANKKELGYSYSDMNIIYRYNKDALDYIKLFKQKGIPYIVKTGDIFEKKEIKFLVEGLSLNNNFSLESLIDFSKYYSDSVGEETLKSIYDTLSSESAVTSIHDFFNRLKSKKISKIGAKRTKALDDMADRFRCLKIYLEDNEGEKLVLSNIYSILDLTNTKFYTNFITLEGTTVAEEIQDNILFISELYYESVETDFIEYYNISVVTSNAIKNGDIDAVQLKTIHGCKGQTLPIVYFIANNMFSPFFIKTPEDIQNEMFVLYVAITRAEKFLKVYAKNIGRHLKVLIPDSYDIESNTNNTKTLKEDIKKDKVTEKSLDNLPPSGYRCLIPDVVVINQTQKAILCSYDSKQIWLPISRIIEQGEFIFVPHWLIDANDIHEWVV